MLSDLLFFTLIGFDFFSTGGGAVALFYKESLKRNILLNIATLFVLIKISALILFRK